MKLYKLAQQLTIAGNRKEWIDIASNEYEKTIRQYAGTLKERYPEIVLGLRVVEETELSL